MPSKGDFKNVPAVTHLRERVQKQTSRTALAGIPLYVQRRQRRGRPPAPFVRQEVFLVAATNWNGFLPCRFMVS